MAQKKFSTRWRHLYFSSVMCGVSRGPFAQRNDRLDVAASQAIKKLGLICLSKSTFEPPNCPQ